MSPNKPAVLPIALAAHGLNLPYLALGMVTANIRAHKEGLLAKHYDIRKMYLGVPKEHPLSAVAEVVRDAHEPVILISSYVWNHAINMDAARDYKAERPDSIIIVGGPEIPRNPGRTEEFLEENPFIDIAVLGEGEVAAAEILEVLSRESTNGLAGLREVTGIVFRTDEGLVRTEVRQRLKDINLLPSPYLTGEFEYYFSHYPYTVLETNRGCPYGCVYCDWGAATLQKIAKLAPERILAEIEYIAENKGESIFIADANFGILPQDVEIAKAMVSARDRTGYPKTVLANFAKNGGKYLMEVIKTLYEGGLLPIGILALQTTDEGVLKTIQRANIKTSSYEKLMDYFNSEGIPMASDILVGLPGQTIDTLQEDLQFCFDWKVSVNAFATSMMPNAPMADPEYRKKHGIVVDANNMVASTSTFTEDDYWYMRGLLYAYIFHIKFAITRYYLYFLQTDYGVPAMALIRKWLDAALAKDPAAPIAADVYQKIFKLRSRPRDWFMLAWGPHAQFLFDDMPAFYAELHSIAEREFGVKVGQSELDTIFAAQSAIMPKLGQKYPLEVELEHDVAGYCDSLRKITSLRRDHSQLRPLKELPPSSMTIGEEGFEVNTIAYGQLVAHGSADWELKSPLRFY